MKRQSFLLIIVLRTLYFTAISFPSSTGFPLRKIAQPSLYRVTLSYADNNVESSDREDDSDEKKFTEKLEELRLKRLQTIREKSPSGGAANDKMKYFFPAFFGVWATGYTLLSLADTQGIFS